MPVRRPTTDIKITAIRKNSIVIRPDVLATEEPMEIRIQGYDQEAVPVTVTMRTPGNDFELAVGLLFNEGLIRSYDSVKTVCYCANVKDTEQRFNVVTVELTHEYLGNHKQRSFMSSSACGVCGTTSIADLEDRTAAVNSQLTVGIATIFSIPDQLRKHQTIFQRTGGLHGAAIFDQNGQLEVIREDIGRHNALDKIIGNCFLEKKLPLTNKVLGLSGRIGFELVQKAAVAQIPVIVAVSAPSSLAVKTAERLGITLIGFTRGEHTNIYTHAERIAFEI
ncbi:MAG: formate dehydrogenase accessory sulfurtransferase FdhD [Acidimicrobiaceae bacterium]|nr:formate dehydrogenase accessory sulfurtransferase FdhD [Acidimicrobiaceae bacterium]